MAKKPDAAPPAPAEQRVFALVHPITHDDRTWDTIELPPPTLAHVIYGEARAKGTMARVHQLSFMSGVPVEAVRSLKLRDMRAVLAWFAELDKTASGEAQIEPGEATFELGTPLTSNGVTIAHLTVREPDLNASIVAEKFADKPYQGIAAMLAQLSGHPIAVIHKLTMADLARIEAWFVPFVDATGSMDAGGAT